MTARRSDMSPYAKAQQDRKREANKTQRRKKRPSKKEAAIDGLCGAKKRDGGICRLVAGHATTHPGIGRCRWHGGNLPTHQLNAAKTEAVFLGAPKDINPVEALMWCIKITAGEVEWFNQQLETHSPDGPFFEETEHQGKQMHILARGRADALNRLHTYSASAIKLGIAERAVRMAELYGTSISKLLRGVLEDLQLTPAQRDRAPQIIAKHLILLEQGTLTDEMRKPTPQIPQRTAA